MPKHLVYKSLLLLCTACSGGGFTPEYIKSIGLQPAGMDGVKIRIVFADKQDREIACDGNISIKMDGYTEKSEPIVIYDTTYQIKEDDFRDYKSKDSTVTALTTKYLSYKDFKNQSRVNSSQVFVSIRFLPYNSKNEITGSNMLEFPH